MSKTVLVVDDQFGIRALLRRVFESEGYTVLEAANGNETLRLLNNETIDLVMLDLKIPGMNGVEILREMREGKLMTDVLMMTAYGEHELIQEAMALGARTYLAKPFDINDVREQVRELFGKHPQ
ncbi:response regulator [Salisediminibacterium halotolerans]|uniref:Two-component system, response regulator, stage 0 sporulation protein F n=1 Tax=Salisediminibacterium halotolerans TaxID=517425 RepID=A0A1H9QSX3_9BACI|nr:response regulator [Salisediminibacterium haloalkalitolerans]SER63540.1 two-component system, response regulator, stage 0 sporulation protein F [Salisediminibacterium haloalkalitolerans]